MSGQVFIDYFDFLKKRACVPKKWLPSSFRELELELELELDNLKHRDKQTRKAGASAACARRGHASLQVPDLGKRIKLRCSKQHHALAGTPD